MFVDRYGAEPIDEAFVCPRPRFQAQVLEATKLAIVEVFSEETIECLVHTIPIRALFGDLDFVFRKLEVTKDDELLNQYSVESLPALLFFKHGKLVGKIEGHFTPEQKFEIKEKIKGIIDGLE